MAAKPTTEYVDDARKLLDLIKDDKNIGVRRRRVPWDNDFEIVDFFIDAIGSKEDDIYESSKCRPR